MLFSISQMASQVDRIFIWDTLQGKFNTMVDTLSRTPHLVELASTSISRPFLLDGGMVQQEILMDSKLKIIWNELINDQKTHPHFSLHHGSLLYKDMLVLSPSSKLISQFLWEAHDSLVRGHEGFLRHIKGSPKVSTGKE